MTPSSNHDTVLMILLQHRGSFVLTRTLEKASNLSPASIRQHIASLEKEGFAIETCAERGYCLREIPDRLMPDLVRNMINTSIIGREIYYYTKIDSTNRIAKELAASGVADGTLIIAEEQVAGRGRFDRRWLSPACASILCSLIVYPQISLPAAFRLTIMTALAVVNAVHRVCALSALIKWPNDIYMNGKKVCGILTELSAEQGKVQWAVVGIGINVNGDLSAYPEITDRATTLQIESGEKVLRIDVLKSLLEELDCLYHELKTNGGTTFREEWEKHSMILNRQITVISGNETVDGIAHGIDDNGGLIITDMHGKRREIISGDVSVKL